MCIVFIYIYILYWLIIFQLYFLCCFMISVEWCCDYDLIIFWLFIWLWFDYVVLSRFSGIFLLLSLIKLVLATLYITVESSGFPALEWFGVWTRVHSPWSQSFVLVVKRSIVGGYSWSRRGNSQKSFWVGYGDHNMVSLSDFLSSVRCGQQNHWLMGWSFVSGVLLARSGKCNETQHSP